MQSTSVRFTDRRCIFDVTNGAHIKDTVDCNKDPLSLLLRCTPVDEICPRFASRETSRRSVDYGSLTHTHRIVFTSGKRERERDFYRRAVNLLVHNGISLIFALLKYYKITLLK